MCVCPSPTLAAPVGRGRWLPQLDRSGRYAEQTCLTKRSGWWRIPLAMMTLPFSSHLAPLGLGVGHGLKCQKALDDALYNTDFGAT